jgi:hypothetical protein
LIIYEPALLLTEVITSKVEEAPVEKMNIPASRDLNKLPLLLD